MKLVWASIPIVSVHRLVIVGTFPLILILIKEATGVRFPYQDR